MCVLCVDTSVHTCAVLLNINVLYGPHQSTCDFSSLAEIAPYLLQMLLLKCDHVTQVDLKGGSHQEASLEKCHQQNHCFPMVQRASLYGQALLPCCCATQFSGSYWVHVEVKIIPAFQLKGAELHRSSMSLLIEAAN